MSPATSEEKRPARPRQVTMSAVMSVVGCLVLVFSLVDTLGRLRTPETRTAIEDFLAVPPGSGLGVETPQVVEAMRVLAYVSGALAAAALVFAVFVLQRHRGARVGLSVAAGLLLLTVPVAGLMPLLIALAAALVWSRPARAWYAGSPGLLSEPPRPDPPGQPPQGQSWPPAYPPPGYPQQGYAPQPYAAQYGYPGSAYAPPGRDPDKRPVTVTIAAVLTWIGAGAVIAMTVLMAIVLGAGGDYFVDEFDRAAQGTELSLSTDQVLAVGWAVTVFFLVWALVAAVLAVFAFRRSNAARITLVASAAVAALLSLLMILSVVSVVTLLLSGAAAVLLFTGGANDWYARRAPQRPGERPPAW